MTDLLFISLENWDDIWRRNQFVCATLARRHPGMRILFVGVPRNMGRLLRKGKIHDLLASPTQQLLPEFPNIFTTRPLRVGPEAYEWGLNLNNWLFRRHVAAFASRWRHDRAPAPRLPILWINSHAAYHLVPHIPHAGLIYDITDDWITSTQPEIDRRRTVAADRLLCEKADATIVCSERLFNLKREFTRSIHLIANGVDADHYATIPNRALPIHPQIAALPRPVLGYTGTLHNDRIDLALLAQVADKLTAGSIALVGPSHLTPAEVHALTATGRIHVFPAVPYAHIPEVMRGFDICITPHLVTPFTESLNPIKLWEYLAAGKPIISTPVAGFRDYRDHVRIASTADEFVAAVGIALAEPHAAVAARQSESRRHSWESRVDAVEKVISALTEKPQGTRSINAGQSPTPHTGR